MTLPSRSMSLPLSNLVQVFESLWPVSGAEEWDRPGLTTGRLDQPVQNVLLAVDVTMAVMAEAVALDCNLIVSHHPLLLKGANFLAEDQLKGELVSFAIRNSIALYSAHTNADVVVGGVSDVLANAIGLRGAAPLVSTSAGVGHGRIGKLDKPISLLEFANQVAAILPRSNAPVRVSGDLTRLIEKVAVVGGAGDSFISQAQAQGAQCLVTSDLRHHVSVDASTDPTNSLSLVDISHYAAESLWLGPASEQLKQALPSVEFLISKIVTDPWSMTILGKSNHEG